VLLQFLKGGPVGPPFYLWNSSEIQTSNGVAQSVQGRNGAKVRSHSLFGPLELLQHFACTLFGEQHPLLHFPPKSSCVKNVGSTVRAQTFCAVASLPPSRYAVRYR
jgi:hypothetical protein